MNILILGGTVFLGRALVEAALQRGHQLTLFNRGQSNPDLYPEIETIRGDRKVDLSALAGRRWDAAIDTCGYVPRVVRTSAEILAGAVDHYTFVSTLSVYGEVAAPGTGENAPVATLIDESTEDITGETYGPLKALCEQAAERAMPGRVFVPRPGLIVGPHDPTDRFTYWPRRVAQGGHVLAPGRPERPIQFIDVRDLAGWMIQMVEAAQVGIYNAIGPMPMVTMGQLLDTSKALSGSDAHFVWVSEGFLGEQKVVPWSEMPLWVPESDPSMAGFFGFDNHKALTTGLAFQSLATTVRDTLAWDAARPAGQPSRAGISRERETELLRAWRAAES
ncbi:MAG: epimerase [Chloroflexi bacterium]|nr:epimerase [Chloroflexota bacterium]